MPITRDNYAEVIAYHAPDADGLAAIAKMRECAEVFIGTIIMNVPDCADKTAAIRKVREAMMTANAAIVLKGMV